jgi:hypothetical protein
MKTKIYSQENLECYFDNLSTEEYLEFYKSAIENKTVFNSIIDKGVTFIFNSKYAGNIISDFYFDKDEIKMYLESGVVNLYKWHLLLSKEEKEYLKSEIQKIMFFKL